VSSDSNPGLEDDPIEFISDVEGQRIGGCNFLLRDQVEQDKDTSKFNGDTPWGKMPGWEVQVRI
jgi:hypothetical protein